MYLIPHYGPLLEKQYSLGFELKFLDAPTLLPDMPVGNRLPYTEETVRKAIQYGMVLNINYVGKDYTRKGGLLKTIFPLLYGFTKQGAPVIRGYHYEGFSHRHQRFDNLTFRLLRTDRIKHLIFTGYLFPQVPDGFKYNDYQIPKIVEIVNPTTLSINQKKLFDAAEIARVDTPEENIIVSSSKFRINLKRPFNAGGLLQSYPVADYFLHVLKSEVSGGSYLMLMEFIKDSLTVPELGKYVVVTTETGINRGHWQVHGRIAGTDLGPGRLDVYDGQSSFDAYSIRTIKPI